MNTFSLKTFIIKRLFKYMNKTCLRKFKKAKT